MEGKLPEIYWYVFWIGVFLISIGAAYMGGKSGHERAMRALDILKSYADKGIEPPPAMMEQITRQVLDASKPGHHAPYGGGRGALVQGFIGFLFTACLCWGGVALADAYDAAPWMKIAAQAGMAFFGFGSFGFLVTALLTRDK